MKLGLDAKDVNQMCTKLRNHGLVQSEESKAQAAVEETSVIAEVLKQAGIVSSSHGSSSSSSTLGYRGYQAAKQVRTLKSWRCCVRSLIIRYTVYRSCLSRARCNRCIGTGSSRCASSRCSSFATSE